MRSSLLRAAVFALLGLSLQENGSVSAELPKWDIPKTFSADSTLILNVERSKGVAEVKEMLSVAHNLHVKWEPNKLESYDLLLDGVLKEANKVKEEESRSWNPFAKVHPVTVVVEPSDRDYLANGPAGVDLCLKDLRLLDDLLWTGFANQPKHHLSSWSRSEGSTSRAITVLFSAAVPEGCFEKFPLQQQRKVKDKNGQEVKALQSVFVGLNPHIKKDTASDIDVSLDKVQGIRMVTRDWPNSRDLVTEFLHHIPENSRLRLANTPLDLNTEAGRFAQRVLNFHGAMSKGKLLYSVQFPRPSGDDETDKSDDIQPVTPSTPPTSPPTPPNPPSPSNPPTPSTPPTPPATPSSPPSPPTDDDKDGSDDHDVKPVTPDDGADKKPEPSPKPEVDDDETDRSDGTVDIETVAPPADDKDEGKKDGGEDKRDDIPERDSEDSDIDGTDSEGSDAEGKHMAGEDRDAYTLMAAKMNAVVQQTQSLETAQTLAWLGIAAGLLMGVVYGRQQQGGVEGYAALDV